MFPDGTLEVESSTFEGCELSNFIVHGGRFCDVSVVGAKCAAFVHFVGCVFVRVRLAGRLRGNVKLSPPLEGDRIYSGVDWALDVRGVEATVGFALLGVPPPLVRSTAGVDWLVTRDSAKSANLGVLMGMPGGWWAASISRLLESDVEAMVILGPRGNSLATRNSAESVAWCVKAGVMLPIPVTP